MEFRRLPGTQRSIRARTNLAVPRLVLFADRFYPHPLSNSRTGYRSYCYVAARRSCAEASSSSAAGGSPRDIRILCIGNRGISLSLSLSLSLSIYLSIYLSVCLRKLIAGSNGTESVHRSALATWRRQLSRNVSEMRLRRRRHRVEFISGFVRGLISRSEKSWQNRALLGPRFFSEIDD